MSTRSASPISRAGSARQTALAATPRQSASAVSRLRTWAVFLILVASATWLGATERHRAGGRSVGIPSVRAALGCTDGSHTSIDMTCDTTLSTMVTESSVSLDLPITNSGSTNDSYTVSCSYGQPVGDCSGDGVLVLHGQTVSSTLSISTGRQTGTTSVTVTVTGSSGDVATTRITVPVVRRTSWPATTISSAFNNQDDQDAALCANACFAAKQSISPAPYYSVGAPRSVSLVYNGDWVAVRPFLYADVAPPLPPLSPPDTMHFRVKNEAGAYVTFTNGETMLRFANPGIRTVRLGGQFDAISYATGVYSFKIEVTAIYWDHTDTTVSNVRLLVVNARKSPIARGWTVGGLQQLSLVDSATAVIAEGDGSARVFTRVCSSTCAANFVAPSGDFTLVSDSGTGSGKIYKRSYPDSTVVRFDATGKMTKLTDRRGLATAFEYDASGRLTRIYDPWLVANGGPGKAYVELQYGTYGISRITTPGATGTPTGGRVTLLTVASDSTLTDAQDPDGLTSHLSYDSNKRLQRVVNRRGDTTSFVYDAQSWKLARVDHPRVQVDAGRGTTTLALSSDSLRAWQTMGIPTSATSTTAATPLIADSMFAWTADPEGHATKYTVDRWGQSLVTTDALGRVTTVSRSGIFATGITSVTGAFTSYVYNNYQLTQLTLPGQQTQYFHYSATYPTETDSTWGAGAAAKRIFVGLQGRLDSVRVGSQDSVKTRYFYSATYAWRLDSVSDPKGHKTRYHYDAARTQPDSVTQGPTQWSATRFDRFGRDSATRSVGHPWQRTLYDDLNRPTGVYDGVNANPMTFGYDALFRTRMVDPKGQLNKFDYNGLGWVTREYDVGDTTKYIAYRYNRDGLVTSRTRRDGVLLSTTYDALHRLRSRSGTGSTTDSLAYNDALNNTWVIGWNQYSRDSVALNTFGQPTRVITRLAVGATTRRFTVSYSYAYSGDGRLAADTARADTAITFAPRRYNYDPITQRLSSIIVQSDTASFKYNQEFQRYQLAWSGGRAQADSLTTAHQLSLTKVTKSGGATIQAADFGQDSLSRLTDYRRRVGSSWPATKFSYDSLGRLASAQSGASTDVSCVPSQDYGFRGCSMSTSSIVTSTYDAAGNDTISGAATYAAGNRLTSWSGLSYSYDVNGARVRKYNATLSVDTHYEWSPAGQLTKVKWGSGTSADSIQYAYNAFGWLVRKDRKGHAFRYFLWDQGQLLAELDSTGTKRVAEYAYIPSTGQPLALVTGPSTVTLVRHFVEDAIGNVIGVTQGDSLVQDLRYDAWGNLSSITGSLSDTNRLRWKGMMYDGDSTNLYFAQARWYDTENHRFISEDPVGIAGGVNLYAFASDDPVNGSDPSGLCEVCHLAEQFGWGGSDGVFQYKDGSSLAGTALERSDGQGMFLASGFSITIQTHFVLTATGINTGQTYHFDMIGQTVQVFLVGPPESSASGSSFERSAVMQYSYIVDGQMAYNQPYDSEHDTFLVGSSFRVIYHGLIINGRDRITQAPDSNPVAVVRQFTPVR